MEDQPHVVDLGGGGILSRELDAEDDADKDTKFIESLSPDEFEAKAQEFRKKALSRKGNEEDYESRGSRVLLVNNVLDEGDGKERDSHAHHKKKGAFAGVFVPTCENMWGVLIFLRFYFIVGHAGIGQALLAVVYSFGCAFCTTSSMSAVVSSGGVASHGGPYYMISRALGPVVGASVGIMYWLAVTMLSVLEVLGAVEGILMASPGAEFSFCKQVYGSILCLCLALFVFCGISVVTRLGLFFVAIVFFTLFVYYFGLATAPLVDAAKANPMVTGLSIETFKENWYSHYGDGYDFGYVLSVFFPCFTGILSGANRADILRDPPKNLRQGTFGAIIFSLFMYSSFMIMWGMVAKYPYLQGEKDSTGGHRRLAGGGGGGAYVVEEIVWNPFPHAAHIGIIISSLSQALQCLVVAPRLLQSIAKDQILTILNPLMPLTKGEPKRALAATYVVAALLVLIGQLDLVAPLLSMCFLVAYAFMNFSCFALTWLKSPAWRPKGVHKRRWRMWYLGTSGTGFLIAVSIMFTINPWWALGAQFIALCLYLYINWRLEARGWGSAMDGIRFQLALNSLIQLEGSQKHHVNWRPQVLILYRIRLAQELKGIKHHEILRFYSQLKKGNGFCVVACVLEADMKDERSIAKARIEKGVIQSIMKEESIQGFAEVVVAPTWVEGTNYIIQLTGIGGLAPNTVLLDWPEGWKKNLHKATDFVEILKTALAEDKAVLAVRGLIDMPPETVYGTIDIWWMIHDGGFLILLSWLLVQHRTWRKCHLRVFTITEGVSEEQAKAAAELLTKTLRQRRLFDVDVEVILADDEMIQPYTYDWTLRVEDRHQYLEQLGKAEHATITEAIPLEIDDLFRMEAEEGMNRKGSKDGVQAKSSHDQEGPEDRGIGRVSVSDARMGGDSAAKKSTSQGRHSVGRARSSSKDMHERTSSRHTDVLSRVRTLEAGKADDIARPPAQPEALPGAEAVEVVSPARNWGAAVAQPIASEGDEPVTPGEDMMSPKKSSARRQADGGPLCQVFGVSAGRKSVEGSPGVDSESVSGTPAESPVAKRISGSNLSEGSDSVTLGAAGMASETAFFGRTDTTATGGCLDLAPNVEAFQKLNQIIYARSKRAQLVVMNLPDIWGTAPEEVYKFMAYCEALTKGLERVLFVHSSGHEIFDISI